MSLVGVSSYFLWTQKGQTVLPLIRGSGFLCAFKQQATFYHHHVLTAAHVSCPPRFKTLYGSSVAFRAIGERHVSARVLVPAARPAAGRLTAPVAHSLDLEFKQEVMPNTDVASLRLAGERPETLAEAGPLRPWELDLDGIEDGTELVYCGLESVEERANPNDDGLALRERRFEGRCKVALVSLDYGTVLIGSIDRDVSPTAASEGAASGAGEAEVDRSVVSPLPLSLCGGPVLRKSTGKVVGVIVARTLRSPPPRDPNSGALYQDPFLDISENVSLHDRWPLDVAFVPVGEFYHAMRRSEM